MILLQRCLKTLQLCGCAGGFLACQMRTLCSLPEDVIGVILCTLSLIDLARVSPTCRCFYAHYSRQMAVEQKSLCDQAVGVFGLERIKCMVDVVQHFLKLEGAVWKPESSPYEWALASGSGSYRLAPQFAYEPGHICMGVYVGGLIIN
jgi:hypothetical protein